MLSLHCSANYTYVILLVGFLDIEFLPWSFLCNQKVRISWNST